MNSMRPIILLHNNIMAQMGWRESSDLFPLLDGIHGQEMMIAEVVQKITDFLYGHYGKFTRQHITPQFGGSLKRVIEPNPKIRLVMRACQTPDDLNDLEGFRCQFSVYVYGYAPHQNRWVRLDEWR